MSIRIKLMLVSLLFMAVPFMGYEFIADMRQLVQKGQEQALMLEAKAIASVLHERQELFLRDTGILLDTASRQNLYARPIVKPLNIDGNIKDWLDILQGAQFFGSNNVLSGPLPSKDADSSFWSLLAYDNDYLYALFQVRDEHVVFQEKGSLDLNRSDHLRVRIPTNASNNSAVENYLINTKKTGTMHIYKVDDDWKTPATEQKDPNFLATMSLNDSGYTIELRIPINKGLQAGHIAFSIVDYDEDGKENTVISTVEPGTDTLNRILLRSPQIEKILSGLDKSYGRIWVVDQYQRVRAAVGSLKTNERTIKDRWYNRLFSFLLTETPYTFSDHPKDIDILSSEAIASALKNKPNNFTRKSVDEKATILGAAVPIETEGVITGAVVVEQTNNNILALENEALLSVVKRTAVIFILAVITMIWFATRLTYRINRLQRETSQATDESGSIKSSAKITIHAKDELGKLASSIAQMLSSLSQHTRYLERMPRTLRHEILNPLNVISTSLENLSNIKNHTEKEEKYLRSAKNGIHRLGAILHSLTEASTLEEALPNEDKETFDLTELIEEYMENYQSIHSEYQFAVDTPNHPVLLFGWPESIAQMLDKIIDNAVDFSDKNSLIRIMLQRKNVDTICIYISNLGKHIPESIQENLFESMVSQRSDVHKQKPHLGIGLYVARVITEAHGGEISVRNIQHPPGVEFSICLPYSKPPQQS